MTDQTIGRLAGYGAIIAPLMHVASDIIEVVQGGYSDLQLWINYVAFAAIPGVVLALYVLQRPTISAVGLIGALVYGFAFIFFSYTTLYALSERIPDYASLWSRIGNLYTFHGALMVGGGALFGIATCRARIFPPWIAVLFLLGIAMNLVIAVVPVPEIVQVVGSTLRNAGLIGMGFAVLRNSTTSASR